MFRSSASQFLVRTKNSLFFRGLIYAFIIHFWPFSMMSETALAYLLENERYLRVFLLFFIAGAVV
jgi:hypothetical protein